jgi:hypothetical protein
MPSRLRLAATLCVLCTAPVLTRIARAHLRTRRGYRERRDYLVNGVSGGFHQ